MVREIEAFYLSQVEPTKSTFLALRDIILSLDANISSEWKYRLPFFCYKGKMFCYLWKDKHSNEPYIGIVEGDKIDHPLLEKGNRKRMKILRINPNIDIPIDTIILILTQVLDLYIKGVIKTKK